MKFPILLCMALAILAGSALAGERCLVIDGDTLVCNRHKVRLTNVYAAELNEAGGAAAKRRLQEIIGSGEVTLKPHGHDRYGRVLAEVFVNARRIEQADIGPRLGRGSQHGVDRHYLSSVSVVAPRKKKEMSRPAASQGPNVSPR